ncbi:MAG: TonB-dependent receptor plug domain-containing protein [Sediminibacterium sp.]
MRLGLKILICCTLLYCVKSSAAQNRDTLYNQLDSVLVTSRNIKTSQVKTPYVISAIDQNQIRETNARTTPEALQGVAGVFLQKTNHGGGSAFIRGLTGNQTLLVIDGIRLNNATYRYGPNQYLNTIDMFTLEKLEVFKGIGAIEYGSDAMGGVIHLTTKEANTSGSKDFKLSNTSKFLSSQMEKTNRTEMNYAANNWSILGGLSIKRFGDIVGGEGIGHQAPSGYREKNYDIKAKVKLTSNQEITLSTQNTIQRDIPIYHKIVLENFKINQVDKQVHNLNYLKYRYANNSKVISEILVTLSQQRSIENRSNQKNNASLLRKERDTIHTTGITAEMIVKPRKNWISNTGVDIYSDLVNSNTIETNTSATTQTQKRGLYPNGSTYNNNSLFNIHYLNLGKLSIIAGIRYNFLDIRISDTTLGNVTLKPSALVTNYGFNYQLHKNHFIFGSISTGYRAPNIDDLGTLGIVDFRYEIPSYNLKPEKSKNIELGYKYNAVKTSLAVSVFQMNLKDVITRIVNGQVMNGYNVYTKKNIESSYIKGTEISVSHQINNHFDFQSNATYTYGQNVTKNEPMRRMPPFFGQNKLSWHSKNKTVAIRHQFAGKQTRLAKGDIDDNRIGVLGTAQWNTIQIDAGIRWKHVALHASAINLLNEKYKTHGSGIYGMGRAFGLSVNWHL